MFRLGKVFICAGDTIEKNEMGRAYNAYWRGERHVQGFGGEI